MIDKNNSLEESTVFSKPEYSEKPPLKLKTKRIISVCSVFLAIVIIAGAVFFATKLKTPTTESSIDTSINIISEETDNIKSISVKTNSEKLTFYSGEDSYSWFIKGVDIDLTNSNEISSFISKCCSVSAEKELSETDETKLGFKNPYLTVTVKSNKTCYTLIVGNLTANEDTRYVKLKETDSIYTVSTETLEHFNVNALSFASTSVVSGAELSEADEENEEISSYFNSGLLQYFDECSAGGGSMDYTIKLKNINGTSYKMVYPYNRNINSDSTVEFLSIIKYGLTADGVYSYNQENLSKYGLDNPIKLKITAADKYSVKLNIGSLQKDGCFPVTASGRKPVFKIKADEFDFLFVNIEDYFSKHIISDTVSEFSKVTVKCENVNSTYTFLKKDDDDTEPTTKLNGSEIEFEQFRRLYKRVLGMSSTDLITGNEKSGETVLTLSFEYSDLDLEKKVLTVKKYKARKYLVFQNNKAVAIVSKTDVTNIINSATAIANGKQISDIDI